MTTHHKSARRQCYVVNPAPSFVRPAHHRHRLPAYNKRLLGMVQSRDVTRWVGFYYFDAFHHRTNRLIVRKRHFNRHRACALNALVEAMVYHLNIVSGTIPVSFTTLARESGLATTSAAGNESITRATRAAQDLAAFGLITYKLLFDKVTRQFFPADIEVTDRFFDMAGSTARAWASARNQQLAWINQGLVRNGEKPLTLTEARRRQKEKLVEITWQKRKAEQDIRRKQKMATLANRHSEPDLRHQISCQIQREMSQGQHQGLSLDEFRHLVNKRLAWIYAVARPRE
ncbi:plasmid replication initiator RepA [Scandinavium sp. NPDC088450]|uniref:plasmid replication initiator RepA n=1 Tax=Scandinavium sp. NPDC088450 TaxID=3364514 RepID=UPI00384ADFEE